MTDRPKRLVLVRSSEELSRYESDWNALLARQSTTHFYQEPAWYRACWPYCEAVGQPFAVSLLYAGDDLVAMVPVRIAKRKRGGLSFRSLEMAKYDLPLHDAAADPAVGDWFSDWLAEIGGIDELASDVVRFTHLPEESNVLESAGRSAELQAVDWCDLIDVIDHDERLAGLSKNFRGNLRKARNRVEGSSGIAFEVARTGEEIEPAFDRFVELEGRGWKSRHGETLARHPLKAAFYRDALLRYAATARAEIFSMLVDGTPVGSQLALRTGTTHYLLKIAYDPEHGRLAPGNMLLERLLRRLYRSGEARTVNLISGTPWHLDWKPRRLRTYHAYWFRPGWRGRLARLAHQAMRAGQNLGSPKRAT